MPVKKSVRLTNDTIKTCGELSPSNDINWSGSINQMSERYQLFAQYCLPELTQGEKNALAQAFNGKLFSNSIEDEVKMLHWQVGEAIQYDNNVIENLGDTDPQEFYARVKKWGNSERLAVICFVNKFWTSYNQLSDNE